MFDKKQKSCVKRIHLVTDDGLYDRKTFYTINFSFYGHNKKTLEITMPPKTKLCNCLRKENCPMRGACLTENILYYARVSCDDETHKPKLYKGTCKTTFKKLYANHKKSFNVQKNKNDTKLSTEYWKLANNKLHSRISWSIKDIKA